MSATPRGVKGPPKLIRILMLPLLIILLLLLVAYAALPYLPLRPPVPQAATTPIAPLTETPPATPAAATPTQPPPTQAPSATPTEVPPPTDTPAVAATEAPTGRARPTNTPVVVITPTATRTPASLAAATPTSTRARPSPTSSPTAVSDERAGDVQALAETAQPPTPPPSPTAPGLTTLPSPVAAVVTPVSGPTLSPPPAAAPAPGVAELLTNADFTRGYQANGVAVGWNNFSNSHAEFHYRADDWPRVIVAPDTGQTLRIRNADLPDRYLGIYQTVNVVPGQVYTFSIAGLVRTNAGDVQHTRFGYRMEVGFDTLGTRNWKRVPEWLELPWDEQARVQDSYRIEVFTTTVEAESEKLTVFIRAWKKWADAGEGAYDVLRASLIGPVPRVAPADGGVQALGMPVTGQGDATLWDQVRMAITLLLLAVLIGGALSRLRPWRVR